MENLTELAHHYTLAVGNRNNLLSSKINFSTSSCGLHYYCTQIL